MTMDFPRDRYLARIGLDRWPALTAAGLAELVSAQGRAIAFENLDVLSDIPVDVSLEAVIDKVLGRGRGGYCFELNGLLGAALQAAGFSAERRLARVSFRRPAPGPRTHLLWLVEIGGETWLADAGFGGPGALAPIRFIPGVEFEQHGARFRLVDQGDHGVHLQRWIDDAWADIYLIDQAPVQPMDIDMGNHFTSTWPKSPFRNIFMVYVRDENGSWGIEGDQLIRRDARFLPVEQRALDGSAALDAALREQFGLDVPMVVVEKSWQRVMQQRY